MTPRKTVVLKGELHDSAADLRQEKALLSAEVDVLVLERARGSPAPGEVAGWFHVSIALLSWILASVYQSKSVLVDLADVQDVEVVYTRDDDGVPLATAPPGVKLLSAGLFYTLVPTSLWIGFVTRSNLAGSLLLFLGLVLPVLVVRIYNTNRPDAPRNRDRLLAETIASAGAPGDVVLAVVGAAHLPGVERALPPSVEVVVHPPVHDALSLPRLRSIGLPTLKAGFVLFSLYVLSVWVVLRVVAAVAPIVAGVLG